jgi:hypothetical protein
MKEYIVSDKTQLTNIFNEINSELKEKGTIKIKTTSPKGKTNEQLGYYWASVVPTITKYFNENGIASARLTESDINEVLNKKFFYKEVVIDGEMQRITRSKATASREEMSRFLEDVIMWANNLGIFIPPAPVEDIF